MELRLLPSIGNAAAGVSKAGAGAAGAAAGGANFAKALDSALKTVSQMQNDATSMQRLYQSGADSVSLEDTMVSMQKAQIGFQAALTVRNRMVAAYTDIMNMQV